MYRRILVPLDGSELAERALPHALQIAQCQGSELHLARVQLPPVYVDDPVFTDKVLEADRQAAEAYLAKLHERLDCPDLPVTTAVLKGAAAEAVVDYARTQNIDLIIMSSHGRSGLRRWMFGSVAERVLRGTHCPTLIVRDQPHERLGAVTV